jgi:hypothetical protein
MGWSMGEPADALWQNFLRQLDWKWQEYLKAGILEGVFGQLGVVTVVPPAAGTNNYDNFNPAGASDAAVIQVEFGGTSPGFAANITGIAGGVPGRILHLMCITVGVESSSWAINLSHQNAASLAQNRILLPGNSSGAISTLTIRQHCAATLWYDGTASRWRVLSFTAGP